MKHGRWYPYCIVLEDGKVLTIGGFDEWGAIMTLLRSMIHSKSWSIKYDSTTSNTYCVGWDNPSAPPGLPCYGGSKARCLHHVSLYPRALFMPTGLVAVAGQSKTTRTWNPRLENGHLQEIFQLPEVMEIWYCYHSIITPQKTGQDPCLRRKQYIWRKCNHCCPTFDA